MLTVVDQGAPSVRHAMLRIALTQDVCTPGVLTVLVTGKVASVTLFQGGTLDQLLPIPWAQEGADINARIVAFHKALESFRNKWSLGYLDAVPAGAEVRRRLGGYRPICDWSAAPAAGVAEAEARWKPVAVSPQLRELAVIGRRLYVLLFGRQGEPLRGWADGLPPGSRLRIYWSKEDRGPIESIPWPWLYQGPEPKDGEPVDAERFLGLRYRLEHIEAPPADSFALGRPEKVFQGFLFFWKGAGKPEYDEAQDQFRAWSGAPTFVAVPEAWPPPAGDGELKGKAQALLRGEDPSPMRVVYVYCQCDLNDGGPKLYFGDPNGPEVTISETELPGPEDKYSERPLVFVNACSTAAPAGILKANLLESNFLGRGCRAYLGTVNRVPTRVAGRFAQAFFRFFMPAAPGAPCLSAGEAAAQARLFLWREYRNISGLYYHYVNNYDLFMMDEGEQPGGPGRWTTT